MPMLMLQCKTCGEFFPGIYVPEESTTDFKATATNADTLHTAEVCITYIHRYRFYVALLSVNIR